MILLTIGKLYLKWLKNKKGCLHKHPAAKSILAEFKDEPEKIIEFNSLNSLVKHLKGDRKVIRRYL